jgi:hypothetical protein
MKLSAKVAEPSLFADDGATAFPVQQHGER